MGLGRRAWKREEEKEQALLCSSRGETFCSIVQKINRNVTVSFTAWKLSSSKYVDQFSIKCAQLSLFFPVWEAIFLGEDLSRVVEWKWSSEHFAGRRHISSSDTGNLECWQSFHKLNTIPPSNWQPDGLAAHKSNDTGGPACSDWSQSGEN